MAAFVPKVGPVTGCTVYIDNQLKARDTSVTLPEITPTTADVQAMGTMTVPVWQLLENMEMTFTKVGIDMGFRSCLKAGVTSLEVRFTQTVIDAQGQQKTVLCKAFCRGTLGTIPGIGLEVGSAVENELTYHLSRYNLFVDGQEAVLVDRLAGIVKIGGEELTSDLSGL